MLHRDIASDFIKLLLPKLSQKKVAIVAHGDAVSMCKDYENVETGSESDFDTEFLSLKMNISIVDDVYEAIAHLRRHKASHSDAILTDSRETLSYSLRQQVLLVSM